MPTLSVPPLGDRAARVLVVSASLERRRCLENALAAEGHEVEQIDQLEPFLERVCAAPPDVVILDTESEDDARLELLGELRTIDPVHLVPVLVLCQDAPEEEVVRSLLAGADDVITRPERIRELLTRVRVQLRNRRDRDLLRSVQKERIQLQGEALTCPLTGLGNRRAADRALQADVSLVESILVMVVDVDHFKKVNDTWGHPVGDEVLRAIARCLKRAARDVDEVARYGGEEFVVVIRDAPPKSHRAIGERFLKSLRQMVLPPDLGPPRVTASIGAVSWQREPDGTAPPVEGLFSTADRALYHAKRGGRDGLVLVPALHPEEPILVVKSDALA